MTWIVIEGIDCSGKTTAVERLKYILEQKGYNVITTQGIGTSELGQKLRFLIPDLKNSSHAVRTWFMLTAIQCTHDFIVDNLKSKKTVIITDRYINSLKVLNILYPSVNSQIFKNSVCNMLEELTNFDVDYHSPDILITLTQPEEIILERLSKKENSDYLDKEFIKNRIIIQDLYKELAEQWDGQSFILHGINSIEQLDEELIKVLPEKFKK